MYATNGSWQSYQQRCNNVTNRLLTGDHDGITSTMAVWCGGDFFGENGEKVLAKFFFSVT